LRSMDLRLVDAGQGTDAPDQYMTRTELASSMPPRGCPFVLLEDQSTRFAPLRLRDANGISMR